MPGVLAEPAYPATSYVYYLKNGKQDKQARELKEEILALLSDGKYLVIPAGYVTDMATVPKIFWPITPPTGQDEVAFIIHDYLYENHKNLGYSRRFCDRQLRLFQEKYGSGKLRSFLMYSAVRLFGGGYFD